MTSKYGLLFAVRFRTLFPVRAVKSVLPPIPTPSKEESSSVKKDLEIIAVKSV